MSLTVKRFGGIIPMPKQKTFADDELDATTRTALGTLLDQPSADAPDQRHPDGFTYKFELSGGDAGHKEVAVSGAHVPEALRKLLP